MLKLKIMLTFLLFSLVHVKSYSQTENKDVTITASGSGATQEDAKQAALRSAIEQAYGAFISTKTEMLNDQVVADEMISVSAGNIKSYEILSQDSLPNGRWGLTLKAVVSIDKLTSFVEAKGGTVEIKGGLFALNIKQQLLNEQGEIKAVAEMIGLLHEPMQTAFDYSIKSGEPKSIDAESKNWAIPLEVTATCNKNMDFCANYFVKTIAALSLSSEEVTSYQSLNKAVFSVYIKYKGVDTTFYLRKKRSINALMTLTNQWDYYTRLFTVQSGMDESNGIGEAKTHNFSEDYQYDNDGIIINLLDSGQQAATFSWQDKRTLSQIEQMEGYKVKPRGVVSQFKHGGFVVYEENGHGFVVAIFDVGDFKNEQVDSSCNNFSINGYSDWRVPTKDELDLIYHFSKSGLGNFSFFYWSSTKGERNRIGQAFRSVRYGMDAGEQTDNRTLGYIGNGQFRGISVRAVRDF